MTRALTAWFSLSVYNGLNMALHLDCASDISRDCALRIRHLHVCTLIA
jgi:hypothetical protein